jgi:hypothetical protein
VDLSRKRGELIEHFKRLLDAVDYFRTSEDIPQTWRENYEQWRPDTSRQRDEAWQQLKVWRLRKERMPFAEIARRMVTTEDATKKAFYTAYERTQGRPYDPERYRRCARSIYKDSLERTCETCPERDTCTELCPEMMRYVDQDTHGRREHLTQSGDILYSQKHEDSEDFINGDIDQD